MVLSAFGQFLHAFPDNSDPSTSDYFFDEPGNVAVDSSGNIYVADWGTPTNGGQGRVVVLSPSGRLLYTFPNASNPSTSNYRFNGPQGIAVDSVGNIYVGDTRTPNNGGFGGVIVLSPSGNLLHTFPNVFDPSTSNYYFSAVVGVAVDSSGNIYAADFSTSANGGKGRVVVLSPSGRLLYTFPNAFNPSTSNYQFDFIVGVTVDTSGTIYVADGTFANGSWGRLVVLAGLLVPPQSVTSSSLPSSSTPPLATSVSLSSSPSSTATAAFSDPRFVGFWGQSFFVSGKQGSVYSLISDQEVQVNAYFFYLRHIRCPLLHGPSNERCINHPGTYFGVLAIFTSQGDHLRITAGEAEEGFHTVELNGHDVDMSYSSSISVQPLSPRSLLISVGSYEVEVENMDLYLDVVKVGVNCWKCLVDSIRPEGLLGRTWNASQGQPQSEEEVDQYRERDDNIMGCNTQRNRFAQRGTRV